MVSILHWLSLFTLFVYMFCEHLFVYIIKQNFFWTFSITSDQRPFKVVNRLRIECALLYPRRKEKPNLSAYSHTHLNKRLHPRESARKRLTNVEKVWIPMMRPFRGIPYGFYFVRGRTSPLHITHPGWPFRPVAHLASRCNHALRY